MWMARPCDKHLCNFIGNYPPAPTVATPFRSCQGTGASQLLQPFLTLGIVCLFNFSLSCW